MFPTAIWIALLVLYIPGILSQTTHEFNWTLSTIIAKPDGRRERPVVAINGEFPLPVIRIKRNDRVVINLLNNMTDSPTSLHFHGLFQKGTSFMDGAVMISQCPIPPGEKFTYDFKVEAQSGTYWYHSHDAAQYGDGLRGAFIVEDPLDDTDRIQYDEDRVILLSDWYYTPSSILVDEMNAPGRGHEPRIDSALFNETHDVRINVEKGKTYYFRLINVGMSASQYFYIQDHNLIIVEIDGVKVKPFEVESVKLATGQRYGVLLKTKDKDDKNYGIVQITNIMMHKKYDVAWLIYDEKLGPGNPNEVPRINTRNLKYIDDMELKPKEIIPKLPKPDHEISFTFDSEYFTDKEIRYYTMNGKPHLAPKVPTMNTVFSADSSNVMNPLIYGSATNAFILQKGDVVQLIVNSDDHMRHPFHLHGHNFQVLSRGRGGHFEYDDSKEVELPKYPMIRDTVEVPGRGHVVLRFVADNPGVWFFHCHTEWHAVQGLGVVFVEAPDEVLEKQKLPSQFYEICEAGGFGSRGNAAGNKDMLNLEGQVSLDDEEEKKSEPVKSTIATTSIASSSSTFSAAASTEPMKDFDHYSEASIEKKTIVLIIYFAITTSLTAIGVVLYRLKIARTKKKKSLMDDDDTIETNNYL